MPRTDAGHASLPVAPPVAAGARRPGAVWHRWAGLSLVFVVGLLAGQPAFAQQFGRWSWEAGLRASKKSFRTSLGDERVGDLDEGDLRLSLGVKGFVLHPTLARFRLGLETHFSSYGAGSVPGSRRWGGDAQLRLLPLGKYRLTLSASRQNYDYTGLVAEDPLTLLGIPDVATGWGARLRIAQGRLRGLTAGLHRNRLSFLEPDAEPEDREDDFVDWSAAGHRYNRHFRLERRYRDYGAVDFSTEDIRATYEQLSRPGGSWRWDTTNTVFLRDVASEASGSSSFDHFRTRQVVYHTTPGNDVVEIRYVGGLSHGSTNSTLHSHSLFSRYRWRTGPELEIAPLAGYEVQVGRGANVSSPTLGVQAIWSRHRRTLELQVNSSLSFARRKHEYEAASSTDSTIVIGLVASAARGQETRNLRTRLDVAWNRNELRAAGLDRSELPDLGVSLVGLGSQDSLRGRLTLSRRWNGISVAGYSEAEHRRSSRASVQPFSTRALRHNFQVSFLRLSLAGNLINTQTSSAGGEQHIDVRSLNLSWRALHMLSIWGYYRDDSRRVAFAPDIDGKRYEAGADLSFGAFVLTGRTFRVREAAPGLTPRTSSGFEVALSRRFGGWLPFVTGRPGLGVVK